MSNLNTGKIPNEKRLALFVPEVEDAAYYSMKLKDGRGPLQERIDEDNKELRRRLSGQTVPRVKFNLESSYKTEANDKYRIILGKSENDMVKYTKAIYSSHTVFAMQKEGYGCKISQCGSKLCDCLMTFNDILGLDIVIRSIALDIQVSHALHKVKAWTTEEKRQFSLDKASYLGMSSCPKYVCFALDFIGSVVKIAYRPTIHNHTLH